MKTLYSNFLAKAFPLIVGLAALTANAAPTVNLNPGLTTVVLAPSFLAAAKSLGVTIQPISPGVVNVAGNGSVSASFPIVAAPLDEADLKAEIIHLGGLSLTAGKTVVTLTNFIIDTTGTQPVLSGLVTLDGSILGRADLFNLSLPSIKTPLALNSASSIAITPVGVTLTSDAAGLLNEAFNVKAFVGSFNIGTATVQEGTPATAALLNSALTFDVTLELFNAQAAAVSNSGFNSNPFGQSFNFSTPNF